jgi:hypothetical protein
MKNSEIVTPLIYNQVEYPDYGIHKKTGDVYSRKNNKEWRMLTSRPSNPRNPKASPYPVVGVYLNGKQKKIRTHVAVHETLNPTLPLPPGITKKLWKTILCQCDEAFLDWVRSAFQVNHINHNTGDYTPPNLEWVTAQQNVEAFQEHRKRQAA